MGTVARLFNLITKHLTKTDIFVANAADALSNPNKERLVTSATYEISQNPRISRSMSLEARRNRDGTWNVQRVTMVYNRGGAGSISSRPDFDVQDVLSRVEFRQAVGRILAFEKNMKMARLEPALGKVQEADWENVHRVLARISGQEDLSDTSIAASAEIPHAPASVPVTV